MTVFHDVCRKDHIVSPAASRIAVGIGLYIGRVRCAGVVLHVYATNLRARGLASRGG